MVVRKDKTIFSLIVLSGPGIIPSFQRCLLHPRHWGHHAEKADTLPEAQGRGIRGVQESSPEEVNPWEGYAGVPPAGTQAKTRNHILDQGNPTWVWVTGVPSQSTTEYSFLTCAQTIGGPPTTSLTHFPQWAGPRLSFSMSVMTWQSLLLKNSRNAAFVSLL